MSSSRRSVLWVVGKPIGLDPNGHPSWAIVGVFRDKDHAVRLATERDGFVGPLMLNKTLPTNVEPWPGQWYPAREDEPPRGESVVRKAGLYGATCVMCGRTQDDHQVRHPFVRP